MRNPPRLALLLAAALFSRAQNAPQSLNLRQAEQIALHNHPRIASAALTAQAAAQVTAEVRSAYMPQVFGNFTGAGASDGSRIAAGALNNPVIYDRLATGFAVSQLLTDFGRTSNLVSSANLRAQSRQQNTEATRGETILTVDRAYFAVMRAENVLRVAQETVKARQLVVDQVTALAQSKLKSTLDVSFANVNLSEAKLLLASAENDVKAAAAALSTALGYPDERAFTLAEEPMPGAILDPPESLVREAFRSRPELAAARLEEGSAQRFAKAERALAFPTVSTVAAVGYIPSRQADQLVQNHYGAVGLNVSIPVLNGGLLSARRTEADLRALAAGQDIKDLENRIARDVRVAYLNAVTAYQRVGLTAQLLDQARLALDLSQSRYQIGLGSIVELSQAQLNATSAEIASVSAKYDYQTQRALLDYETGTNR